jgi:peptide-methionine (S)-S-oxide reductase
MLTLLNMPTMLRTTNSRIGSAALLLAALFLLAYSTAASAAQQGAQGPAAGQHTAVATFAGGCFWCEQAAFEKIPGVISVTSGYTGGNVANPTYEQVSAGGTGHKEAVEVVYDPAKVSYSQLLDRFWHNADPTDAGGQFCDKGPEYRAEIFYHDEAQRHQAEESKQAIERSKRFKEPIVTEITKAGPFYRAEEYHQDYHSKNPLRYKFYRFNCGRDQRLQQLWGHPGD